MAKGGHNRKPDAVKQAKGTFKPSRYRAPSPLPALEEWPPAPERFNEAETEAWERLGESLMLAGTVSAPDLLLVSYVAQVLARVDQMMADASAKPANINALLRVVSDLLKQLGLTPMARNTVTPLSRGNDAEDELSEFD